MTQYTALCGCMSQLITVGRRTEPQIADVRAVAPHLTQAEARELLVGTRHRNARCYFVGPPLFVRGALQLYALDFDTTPPRVGKPPQRQLYMHYAYAARLKASYVARPLPSEQQVPRDASFRLWAYAERATDWAEVNWHEQLHWDESQEYVEGFLLTPSVAPVNWYVSTHFAAWLSRPLAAIEADDTEPPTEVLDDAILEISYSYPLRLELLGSSAATRPLYYCALCGGGIGDRGKCDFCDTIYAPRYLGEFERPWHTALPTKALRALPDTAALFQCDPIEARKWEHRKWAASSYVPATRPGAYGREHRSIDLGG